MIDLTQILKLNEKKLTAIMLFFLQMVILKSLKVLSVRCDTNIEINLIKLLYNNAFFLQTVMLITVMVVSLILKIKFRETMILIKKK
jgi:hypothetical protein